MEIKTLEVSGIASAITALRLPFGKDCRSQVDVDINPSGFSQVVSVVPNQEDIRLMSTLVKRGDEHAKVVRGMMVYAQIKAPVYWWCEMETYRAGHERLSSESTMHIDCRGLSGEALVDAKASIPMGKELTKVDMFSYQALRNIVRQRYDHRLPEWHVFVDWVKTLPMADDIILAGLNINKEA